MVCSQFAYSLHTVFTQYAKISSTDSTQFANRLAQHCGWVWPNSLFSLSWYAPRPLSLDMEPLGSWQESWVSSDDLRWSGHPVRKIQLTFVQHLKPKFILFSIKVCPVLYLWIWTPECSWLESWVSWEHPWWSGHNANLCFHFFLFLIMRRLRADKKRSPT